MRAAARPWGPISADRYPDLAVRKGPQGTLDLWNGSRTLVARFSDYGFNCGDALLLYGTFFLPEERRGYLAVKCDLLRPAEADFMREARCWVEAESAGDQAKAHTAYVQGAYGGQVLCPESQAALVYRFRLDRDISEGDLLLRCSAPQGKAIVAVKVDGNAVTTIALGGTGGIGSFRIAGTPTGRLSAGEHTVVITGSGTVGYDCFAIADASRAQAEKPWSMPAPEAIDHE